MSDRDWKRTVLLLALAAAYALTLARADRPAGQDDRDGRADLLSPVGRSLERALAEGRAQEALALTRDLRRTFPRDPFVSYLLATVYRALDQPEAEAAAWDEYMRASESPAEACPDVALAYERLGDRARALERLRHCVALEPEEPDRLADLADAYQRAGQTTQARDAYQRAAALDPTNPSLSGNANASGSP